MIEFLQANSADLVNRSLEHLVISAISLAIGVLIAVPTGIALARRKKVSNVVLTVAGVLQTIPTIALLALTIPLFGVGMMPAIIALSIYILLPILNNTIIGVQNIDPNVKDAGKSMGMTRNQVLRMVELPLALSVIIGGLRIALVVAIGVVAIGSFIGSSTLTDIIIRGTNATDGTAMILAGAVPIAIIAIIIDVGLRLLENRLDPLKKKKRGPRPQSVADNG